MLPEVERTLTPPVIFLVGISRILCYQSHRPCKSALSRVEYAACCQFRFADPMTAVRRGEFRLRV